MESMEKNIEELAREERIQYFRKWRAANPEKVRQHNKTYWTKKAKQKIKEMEQR